MHPSEDVFYINCLYIFEHIQRVLVYPGPRGQGYSPGIIALSRQGQRWWWKCWNMNMQGCNIFAEPVRVGVNETRRGDEGPFRMSSCVFVCGTVTSLRVPVGSRVWRLPSLPVDWRENAAYLLCYPNAKCFSCQTAPSCHCAIQSCSLSLYLFLTPPPPPNTHTFFPCLYNISFPLLLPRSLCLLLSFFFVYSHVSLWICLHPFFLSVLVLQIIFPSVFLNLSFSCSLFLSLQSLLSHLV